MNKKAPAKTMREGARFISKTEMAMDEILAILLERDMSKDELNAIMDNDLSADTNIELCKSFGLPLLESKSESGLESSDIISLKTKCSVRDAIFCVVDIETSGSHTDGDIIEMGAIKWQNGEIIDRFKTFVKTFQIPAIITNLTGIYPEDTRHAPQLKKVLWKFKVFLDDCVFVAHNASFDYNFINAKLAQCALPVMKNRKICSLNFARKTIDAPKHGLDFLNEFLDIKYPVRHRAYSDSYIALKVLEHSLKALDTMDTNIRSIEDIIKFISKEQT